LRALTITLPPLRERREDIEPLALHYIESACKRYGIETKGFSPDFFETLLSYDWPGNVRELNQAIEQALASAGPAPTLFAQDLPTEIRASLARKAVASGSETQDIGEYGITLRLPETLPSLKSFREAVSDEAEREYLLAVLKHTHGKVSEARRIAGLSRSRIYTLLKKHGITAVKIQALTEEE
jgi:two-component system NtrC family response regulator